MEEGGIDVRAARRWHRHEPGRSVPLPGIRAGVRRCRGLTDSRFEDLGEASPLEEVFLSENFGRSETVAGADPKPFSRSPSIPTTPSSPRCIRRGRRLDTGRSPRSAVSRRLHWSWPASLSGGGHTGRPTVSAQGARVSALGTAGWWGPRRAVAGPAGPERRRTRRDHGGAERDDRVPFTNGRFGGSGRVHGFAGRRRTAGDERGGLTGADGRFSFVRWERRWQRSSRADAADGTH